MHNVASEKGALTTRVRTSSQTSAISIRCSGGTFLATAHYLLYLPEPSALTAYENCINENVKGNLVNSSHPTLIYTTQIGAPYC